MNSPINDSQMAQAKARCTEELSLPFHGLTVQVFADSASVLDSLAAYFVDLTTENSNENVVRMFLINRVLPSSAADWTPVKRVKANPLGLKEAFVDAGEGRWIHKVRTGMVMFQSLNNPIIFGDLTANLSQVVNFINNQFLNYHQRQGYLLGHAAAYGINGHITAIAASSGGGKSTLMLRALEAENTRFLSNDRILFRPETKSGEERVHVLGLAKHPRVNPGTLINSERLAHIMRPEEQAQFQNLSRNDLWNIEQKYDVIIPAAYGANKTDLQGHLENLVVLDWSLASSAPTALTKVDMTQEPQALDGLRKSPGPFYQMGDGHFPPERSEPAEVYCDRLRGVQVWRLSGQVDFDQAIEQFHKKGLL